jgi:hypothetical protein
MHSSNPSFSIARKYKPNSPDKIPGPNNVLINFIQYNPKDSYQTIHVSFSKSKRQPFINAKGIPGPG